MVAGSEAAMPTIIACPTCQARLIIADHLMGRKVRCASCSTAMDAGDSHPESRPLPSPDLAEAVHINLSLDDDVPPVQLAQHIPPVPEPPPVREVLISDDNARRLRRRHDDEKGYPGADWPYRRRDSDHDRGSTILTLGIIGLALAILLPPIGAVVSLFAFVMGQRDLARIKRGQVDEEGAESTRAGRTCGMFGTVIGFLATLACLSLWSAVDFSTLTAPINPLHHVQD
jgi:predicted Zn finger-like uncharacterized protein